MEVHFYQTGCADAARISFLDEQKKPRHILIDAGFERTFRQLLGKEIATIASRGEKINLWIISHIHDDHIGGALAYVNAVKASLIPDIVEKWWYNAPRKIQVICPSVRSQISYSASIKQGDQLSDYLCTGRSWDRVPILSGGQLYEIGGLKIILLSPGAKQLSRLQKKYKLPSVPLEHIEKQQISEAKGMAMRDYRLRVDELEQLSFNEDNNIENGSSISLLVDYKDFKILWLADAHPSVIAESLAALGYTEEHPIICDWVKVAHHGSAANNSLALYRLIQCSNYVISVNGDNQHGLPNKMALVNILNSRKHPVRDHYRFYFTHDDNILRSIFSADGDGIFNRLNFSMHYSGNHKSIKVVIPDAFKS